jgi:hypothetical protein
MLTRTMTLIALFLTAGVVKAADVKATNLDRLCEKAQAKNVELPLVEIMESPFLLIDLKLQCATNLLVDDKAPSNKYTVTPKITVTTVAGIFSTEITDAVSGFSAIEEDGSVKGQTAYAFIATDSDGTVFATKAFLRVTPKGQPIFEKNDFSAILDPQELAKAHGGEAADYISGTYLHLSPAFTGQVCSSLGEGAEETPLCDKSSLKNGAEIVRSALNPRVKTTDFRFPLSLGWLPGQYPSNKNLSRVAGQVSFATAVDELIGLTSDVAIPKGDVDAILKTATQKLGAEKN